MQGSCFRGGVRDGDHFQEPLILECISISYTVQIIYFVEFTAVLQSGCYAPKYKYGEFYYEPGNIKPVSRLHCIQLAQQTNVKWLSNYTTTTHQ